MREVHYFITSAQSLLTNPPSHTVPGTKPMYIKELKYTCTIHFDHTNSQPKIQVQLTQQERKDKMHMCVLNITFVASNS